MSAWIQAVLNASINLGPGAANGSLDLDWDAPPAAATPAGEAGPVKTKDKEKRFSLFSKKKQ